MATNIPYQQLNLSNLEAADVSTPGNLIVRGIQNVTDNVREIKDNRIKSAGNIVDEQIRTGLTSGDLSGISLQPLIDVGASSAQISAAENNLRGAQLKLLGNQTDAAFQTQLDTNLRGYEQALERFNKDNSELSGAVSVDPTGTISFEKPGGKFNLQQIEQAKNVFSSLINQEEFGITNIQRPRELERDLRAQVRNLGGSNEQADALVKRAQTYRSNLTNLNPEEKAVAEQNAAQNKITFDQEINRLNSVVRELEVRAGKSADEAHKLLQTGADDVARWVQTNTPNEGWWFQFWKDAGIDAQDLAEGSMYKGKAVELNGTPFKNIKPWMVQEAMERSYNKGNQSIVTSDFKSRLAEIALNTNYHRDLTDLSRSPGIIKEGTLQAEAKLLKDNNAFVRQLKSSRGIRDIESNRALRERVPVDLSTLVPTATVPAVDQQATEKQLRQQVQEQPGNQSEGGSSKVPSIGARNKQGSPSFSNFVASIIGGKQTLVIPREDLEPKVRLPQTDAFDDAIALSENSPNAQTSAVTAGIFNTLFGDNRRVTSPAEQLRNAPTPTNVPTPTGDPVQDRINALTETILSRNSQSNSASTYTREDAIKRSAFDAETNDMVLLVELLKAIQEGESVESVAKRYDLEVSMVRALIEG